MNKKKIENKSPADFLNAYQEDYGFGFYGSLIGGRFFKARMHEGELQVTTLRDERKPDWITVPKEKAKFHGPHGGNIRIN